MSRRAMSRPPASRPRGARLRTRLRGLGRGGLGLALGLALLVAAGPSLSACGGASQAGRSRADDAIILVRSQPGDAELWVDERFVGPVAALSGGISLRPGSHRVELRHPDYHTFYTVLSVSARQRDQLTAELAPRLP
ncbi:PEGA domain-containing protein [Haliangium ochraceum]|uniref:PEGA domain protein n=1 Tax=Haliangium ochraceum (strain DSM 14365 / JCM 11303 / SMP-2) TaxID=502025 RepID=D0LV81_HALO1|nr:PEGA domain-containing protein [Haliangium ochraceum]ACY15922.1 PEGA domain protein [Haliangium ochraceum DSM 14365]